MIDNHYQLGNDLYHLMLDKLMTYSCGYWEKATTLEEAQEHKYELISQKLGLKKGMKVLDIGCGWGGFLRYAAEHHGVEGVGVTLSENQAEIARKQCENYPVEIKVEDYRDLKGTFDRIISIGMFEHVGQKNYKQFMKIAHRLLKDEGLMLLHTIGWNYTASTIEPWTNKYIFRNGMLPSVAQIGSAIEKKFVMEDWHNFGPCYDKTLMAWFDNFNENFEKIKDNYPPDFYRMWKFYLLSFAAGFRARTLQLWQITLSKGRLCNDSQRTFRPQL